MLARQPGAIFIGQGVGYDGVAMYHDFEGVPAEQRLEHPICEDLTVGFATGLAMMGYLPVVVIPRIDFLLRAMDQLVNHLDKIDAMSRGQWRPKVIIRTRVGGKVPLDAGPQHTQNHAEAFRAMLTTVRVWEIEYETDIAPTYQYAVECPNSVLIVEAL